MAATVDLLLPASKADLKLVMRADLQHENVVPAQAGTHTPQRLGSITKAELFYNNRCQGLWVPACAGTTLRIFERPFEYGDQVTRSPNGGANEICP